MFTNPAYNFPQSNEHILLQNLAGLSLNSNQSYQFPQQQQQQQQQFSVNTDGYASSSVYGHDINWISPDDINMTYQRGSIVVREHNNSTIDDYYKKFLRPISDYSDISTVGNAQTTSASKNVDGQQAVATGDTVAQAKTDEKEKKKEKKKHKKRSSKHGQSENEKNTTEVHTENIIKDNPIQQQVAPVVAPPVNPLVDANSQVEMKDNGNPVVYFDISIDDDSRGRLIMELFRHALPRTAQNFLSLCLSDHGFGFRHSYFHRIIPGFMAQGGDFEKSDGTGGYSIYGEKFDDEGFPFKHDKIGLLSMANAGPNTNGSQFFLTFVPCPHLDNKHVVFGQILQGFHLLKDLEMSGSDDGEVTREVKITNSGQLQ